MTQSDLSTVNAPLLKTAIPGPQSIELWDRDRAHCSPGLGDTSTLSRLVMSRGRGALVEDVDGNILIDLCAGTLAASTGHVHPKVAKALGEAKDQFIHFHDFATPQRARFFDELYRTLPSTLDTFQMYSGGTETVEAALRLAKAYTGRSEFISFSRGYHGKTMGSLSLLGGGYKKGFGPLAPGFFQAPYPYSYRPPVGVAEEHISEACFSALEQLYETQTSNNVAAVVIEPIQGAGGVIAAPTDYLRRLRKFCDDHGILLIFDEILTSAGRTGKMWALDHSGVVPDIMTMGKGIGSGYPLGVLAARKEIMAAPLWSQPGGGSTTFGGGGIASSVGLATLEVIREEGLVENSAKVGAHMRERLEDMQQRYEVMGDVRGFGLLLGVELVRNRDTKEEITRDESVFFSRDLIQRGVLTIQSPPIIRIAPPLVISQEIADRGLDQVEQSIKALQDHLSGSAKAKSR